MKLRHILSASAFFYRFVRVIDFYRTSRDLFDSRTHRYAAFRQDVSFRARRYILLAASFLARDSSLSGFTGSSPAIPELAFALTA